MKEIWKIIPGYSKEYKVSNKGNFKNTRGITKGCPDSYGYLKVGIRTKDNRHITKRIHVLVARAFLGIRPKGYDICHADGDPANNQLSNLRYDSRSNNTKDSLTHKTKPIGEDHPRAKFTNKQVSRIRASKLTPQQLAQKYNTTPKRIRKIIRQKAYKYLK